MTKRKRKNNLFVNSESRFYTYIGFIVGGNSKQRRTEARALLRKYPIVLQLRGCGIIKARSSDKEVFDPCSIYIVRKRK